MKKSLYFDIHTSLHPFKEAADNLKKPLTPHACSLYFRPSEHKLLEKDLLEEVFKFFGAEFFYSLVLKQDLRSCLDSIAFNHYKNESFHSGKMHVLVFHDAPSLKKAWEAYAPFGLMVTDVHPDQKGLLTPDLLRKAITPRTTLVSVCWANPLTGVIQPIEALAEICKEKGVFLHVDVSSVVGAKYFLIKDLGARYVTFNSLKFFGASPLAGVFFCDSQDAKVEPSKFYGTLNELQALKTTLYHVYERIDDLHLEIARLKRLFEKKLSLKITGCESLLQSVDKLPHVCVMCFPKVMNETFLYFLSLEKVYPSLAENDFLPLAELLLAKEIEQTKAFSSLSFSLSHLHSEEDIEEAVERIYRAYHKALQFSQGM
jgi:cysteine desulfurase